MRKEKKEREEGRENGRGEEAAIFIRLIIGQYNEKYHNH